MNAFDLVLIILALLALGIFAIIAMLLRWIIQSQPRLDEMRKQTAVLNGMAVTLATIKEQNKLAIERQEAKYAVDTKRPIPNPLVRKSAESSRK